MYNINSKYKYTRSLHCFEDPYIALSNGEVQSFQDVNLWYCVNRFPQIPGVSCIHRKYNWLVAACINAFFLMSDCRFCKLDKHFKDNKRKGV